MVNISCGQTSLNNNIDFKIDSLINSSISQKTFPGAQVYIKIGEEILTNKSFGYHTYDSIIKVENNHVYDLASLTKVLASTIALMKLYEDFDLDLNDPISKYFPELKKSNKKKYDI
jgi:CubicO group peptidase (beta-lactamase class C family)